MFLEMPSQTLNVFSVSFSVTILNTVILAADDLFSVLLHTILIEINV